ncbi:MAG: hypothetical protein ABI467_07500 [Kofleriaceae bacterium]
MASACSTPSGGAVAVRDVQQPARDPAGLARHADEVLTHSLTLDYERPVRGKPRELAPVIAAYLAACDAGDGRSCRRAVAFDQQAGGDGGAGLRALVDRCRNGQLDMCRALPDTTPEDHALRGWAGRAPACQERGCDDELRHECQDGFAVSCHVLANHDVSDIDAVVARALALARAGCRADIAPACLLLGDLGEGGDDRTLRDRFRCELQGVHCMEYGLDLLYATPTAARDVFERDCQYSRAHQENACEALLRAYAEHLFPEPIPDRARTVRNWFCAQPGPHDMMCVAPTAPQAAR